MDVVTINKRLNGLVLVGTTDFTQNLFISSRSIDPTQLADDLLGLSQNIFDNVCPTQFGGHYSYFTNLVSLILMRLSNIYQLSKQTVDVKSGDFVILLYLFKLGFRITDYFPSWNPPPVPNINVLWIHHAQDSTYTNGHMVDFDTLYIGGLLVSEFNYDSINVDLRIGIMNAFIELRQLITQGQIVLNVGVNFITDTGGKLAPHIDNRFCDTFFPALLFLFNKETFGINDYVQSLSAERTSYASKLLVAASSYINMLLTNVYSFARPLYDTKTNQTPSASLFPTQATVLTTVESETRKAIASIADLNYQCLLDKISGLIAYPFQGAINAIMGVAIEEAKTDVEQYIQNTTSQMTFNVCMFLLCIAALMFVNAKTKKRKIL